MVLKERMFLIIFKDKEFLLSNYFLGFYLYNLEKELNKFAEENLSHKYI